jgi:hypothetical protein
MNIPCLAVVVTHGENKKQSLVFLPDSCDRDPVKRIEHFNQLFPSGWHGWGIATEEEVAQGKALDNG